MSEQPKTDPGPKTNAPVLRPPDQQKQNPVQRLSGAIATRLDSFAQVATRYLTAERLVKLAQVVLAKNPALADCTTISVLDSLMTCARLGLEPNEPGGVWLVPFKGVCTPIIDYRGMIDVCRRSGDILAVHSDLRCQNDTWEYRIDTTGPNMVTLRHTPADGDRGAIMGAFFVVKLKGGECQATYLSKDQIDGFRKRSRADQKGFSPWQTDYNAMALKTVCRRGVNLLPRTEHVQVLRQELHDEDERDLVPIGELTEGSQEAIERMLAVIGEDDKVLADGIVAGFQALDYGPARQLQLLTRHHGDPKSLVDWLQNEAARRAKPVEQQPAADPKPAAEQPADPKPAAKPQPAAKKKGKGKKGKGATKPAEGATEPATGASEPAPGESKGPDPESAAAPKPDPSKFGASF